MLEVQVNNESAVHELEQTVPHNTDSVVICNDGDNIQDKYDEAAALLPNGNVQSPLNRASLIMMGGTYGDLSVSSGDLEYFVDITGIGYVEVGDMNFNGDLYCDIKNITLRDGFQCNQNTKNLQDITADVIQINSNSGAIDSITMKSSDFEVISNTGTIRNVSSSHITINGNTGTVENVITTGQWYQDTNNGEIKNCTAAPFMEYVENYGIIDNCHSIGIISRAFGGYIGSLNSGTIKNCTATGDLSFGQQDADGVTENCVGAFRAFAGASNSIDFSAGGIEGTYKNCKGENESFFGRNTKTDAAVEMEATYENCTGGNNSFGFVESAPVSGNVGPKTVFAGTAKNCTGKSLSFASSYVVGAQAEIKAGAVIENCTAKNNSFATHSNPLITTCINYGNVIRSRCTGPSGFSATGTGKVRLCLDANFNEINLP